MTDQDIALILARLELEFDRVRPDLPLAGSPDRSLERRVVESADGRAWVVEKHQPLFYAWKGDCSPGSTRSRPGSATAIFTR